MSSLSLCLYSTMESLVHLSLLLFLSIKITNCCEPCLCHTMKLISYEKALKIGDCQYQRTSTRVNKIPTTFHSDIGAIDMEDKMIDSKAQISINVLTNHQFLTNFNAICCKLIQRSRVKNIGQSLTYLDENELHRYNQIKFLDVTLNKIGYVDKNTFRDKIQLEIIYFQNNFLRELPSELFSNTPSLRKFSVSNNNITTLRNNLFANLMFLEEIYLDNNQVEVIEDKCFSNLPSLEKIDLKYNSLKVLHLNFKDLPNLKNLYLHDNPWICNETLCDLINFVTDRKLWENSEIPTCQNKNSKRWDQLKLDDFSPSFVTDVTSIVEGDDLLLQCKYCFISNITWTFNRMKVSALHVKIDERQGISSLFFDNIQKEESGKFVCHIENCQTCQDASVYLKVMERALIISTASEEFTTDDDDINLEYISNESHVHSGSSNRLDMMIPLTTTVLFMLQIF